MFPGSTEHPSSVYRPPHLTATTHFDPTLHLKNASDSLAQTDGLTSADETSPCAILPVRELVLQIALECTEEDLELVVASAWALLSCALARIRKEGRK